MAAAISFLQSPADATNATEYTFSSQSLGAAASDRLIIVAVHTRKLGGSTTIGVTVGGVTATNVITQWGGSGNDNVAALFVAEVPTGTTGDVVVTFGAECLRAGIGMWRATGVDTTAFDTAFDTADPLSTTIDVEAGGFAIGAMTATGSSGTPTFDAGLTDDYGSSIDGEAARMAGAHDEFVSAQTDLTVSVSYAFGDEPYILVVASWSEASASGVTGSIAATETDDTMAASGAVAIAGAVAATEEDDTASAAGAVLISGTVAATEENDTIAASGKVLISGTSAVTEADDTAAATGAVAISGSIAATEEDDTMAANDTAKVDIVVVVSPPTTHWATSPPETHWATEGPRIT